MGYNQFTEKKEFCLRGHPRTPENLSGDSCKICRKIAYDAKAKKTKEEKSETRRKMFEENGPMSIWHPNRKYSFEETSFRGLYNHTKQSARVRGKSFDLIFEDFARLSSENCHWCGREPFEEYNQKVSKNGYTQDTFEGNQHTMGWIKYTGLDRIDNSLGYTVENLVPACKWCNFARNIRSPEDFRTWIKQVHDFQFGVKVNFQGA